jgi:hypothetical protein
LAGNPAANAAGVRSKNFTVDAPTPQLAQEIAAAAEQYRKSLAIEWLGQELPPWSKPCPIKARVAPQLGAGGATSFVFDRGEVFGWHMDIQGSRERVLDSVLPHEITHTIFASHFRQPLPRWADEGACTTVEHRSEIAKQERMLIEFLHTRRGIAFSDMFAMKEYPADILPLYAQGYALSEYLIGQRGKREFLSFLADGMQDENWPRAIREHYGYRHLLALQNSWIDWVRAGRPPVAPVDDAALLAMREGNSRPVVRGQDPGAGSEAGAPSATNATLAASSSPAAWQAVLPVQTAPSDREAPVAATPTVYESAASGKTMLR